MKKVILLFTLALIGANSLKGMEVPEVNYDSLPSELKQEIINLALERSTDLNEAIRTIQGMGMMHGLQYDNFKDVTKLVTALANKFPDTSREKIIETLDKKELLKQFKLLLPKNRQEIIKMALASSDTFAEKIEAIKVASALFGISYNNLPDFTALMLLLTDKYGTRTSYTAEKFATPVAEKYIDLGKSLIAAVTDNKLDIAIQSIEQGADVNYSNSIFNTPLSIVLLNHLYECGEEQIAMLQLLLKQNLRFRIFGYPSVLDYMKRIGTRDEVQQIIKEAMAKQKK